MERNGGAGKGKWKVNDERRMTAQRNDEWLNNQESPRVFSSFWLCASFVIGHSCFVILPRVA